MFVSFSLQLSEKKLTLSKSTERSKWEQPGAARRQKTKGGTGRQRLLPALAQALRGIVELVSLTAPSIQRLRPNASGVCHDTAGSNRPRFSKLELISKPGQAQPGQGKPAQASTGQPHSTGQALLSTRQKAISLVSENWQHAVPSDIELQLHLVL